MKRFILCSIILATIISASIFLLNRLGNYNSTLNIMLDEAIQLCEKEKTEQALSKVEEITRFWDHYYIKMSIIVPVSRMADISTSISKLKPLLINGSDEFSSECENIKYAIKLIYDSQYPSFHSIV